MKLQRLDYEKPSMIRWTILLAPIIFLMHAAEETPGFVKWFNNLVTPGISQSLFLSVNAFAFIITIILAGMLAVTKKRFAAILMLAWLGFLMLANALFHLAAAIAYIKYCPGVVTAVILYLPYFVWFFRIAVRYLNVHPVEAFISSFIGSIPMAVHGYLIVFRGDRLF
jgi:hypothetical protein